MDYITTKFNSTVHLDSIKSKIEDIINIIAKELCLNRYLNVELIENKIKEKYPDYLKLCTIASTQADNLCNTAEQIIFNRNRMLNIIEQMHKNRDFVRMCRFKYGVISRSPEYLNIPLHNVIYNLNGYNILSSTTIPILAPSYFTLNPYNVFMFGGNKTKDGEMGKIVESNQISSVKFVDFYKFEEELIEKNKHVDFVHISADIYNGYEILQQLDNSDEAHSIIDVMDEIERLQQLLQYMVVPLDTYKRYVLIKK